MEVKLDKRYPLDVGVEQAWALLSDVSATASCMPGAQITEQVDATHYKGTVKSKVGPASMTFNGDIEVLALDASTRSLQLLGKGADKSGSSASMNLAAHVEAGDDASNSVLVGHATFVVSGKLAQFGSRLLVPVSDALLAQFAANFRKAADQVGAPVAGSANELNAASLAWTVLKGMARRKPKTDTTETMDIHVRNNTDAGRFEADVDGGVAACNYRREGDVVVFTHTEVPPQAEGQGVAAKLVEAALGWARTEGLRVKPECAYVAGYIQRHPETQDLLAG